MSVGDYMTQGYSGKQTVKILTVDPASRKIEATLRDGGRIDIVVWTVPSLFRWPKVDEVWTVRQDSGYWVLDALVESSPDQILPIESLSPGDTRITTGGSVFTTSSILDPTNVKYYGAKGDGITNDTVAILEALHAIPPNGVLFFPQGTYIFTSVTCATNGITLYGKGTLKSIYSNDNTTVAVWLAGGGVTVDGLTFVNANPQTPFAHAARGNVENGQLLIVGPFSYSDPSVAIATVKNCTFHGAYSSQLEIRNSYDVIVRNNRLYDNSGNGMSVSNTKRNVLIEGNRVYNTGDDMIVCVTDGTTVGGTQRITIVNNICDTGDTKGIATTGADKIVIANNQIRNTYTFGIAILEDSFFGLGPSNNASVHDNTLERCGYKFGADTSVNLHAAAGTVPISIFVSAGSKNVEVHDNVILDTYGIAIVGDTAAIATTTTGIHTFPTGTVNVVSTATLPSFGTVTVFDTDGNTATITYTGKTSTTLTGVTGGVGTFAAGSKLVGCLIGLNVHDNLIVGAGSSGIQIGNPDGVDWIRGLDVSINNNTVTRTSGGIVAGSITGLLVLGNKVRSYKQGYPGARRGILLGSNRNAIYDHNIVFNDDGGDEPILVYGANKHVVDGGTNITLAPSDP